MKHYSELAADKVAARVSSMVAIRSEYESNGVAGLHVKLSFSNRKNGANVPSVSLIPVEDCPNCEICKSGCYDIRNVCFQKTVQKSRANNSAIFRKDPERYFREIETACKFLRFFRWHVGGDMVTRSYFLNVVRIAENVPECQFLIFTKLYGVVNKWLDEGNRLPANLHLIFSDWAGAKFDNRHNLPVSSPLWPDGSRGPHCTENYSLCPGFCEDCAAAGSGCWNLNPGDTILFEAH